jgi:hypothetical protein
MRVSKKTDHPDAWGGFVFLASGTCEKKGACPMRRAHDGEISFIANIPHQIEADWNPRYAHLAGFPLNIMFTGIRKQQGGTSHVVAACYWFDPGTYQENEEKRQMTYVSRTDYGYHVEVVINKKSGVIESRKYKGQRLISQSRGDSFDLAMINATLCGAEPDEGKEVSEQL